MYIEVDKHTEELVLNLPPDFHEYESEVREAVLEEFAFEGMSRSVLQAMNRFVISWFKERGKDLPAEPPQPVPPSSRGEK